MSESPPKSDDGSNRLHRCIRDLATLNALPSMCIGRSFDEALDIVVDALPTALACDLVLLVLPGTPPTERAVLLGRKLAGEEIAAIQEALAKTADVSGAHDLPNAGAVWCLAADVPLGADRGRLVAARRTTLDPDTDRVLVRAAANLVGTTLETARILESARRKDEFLAMLGHELRNPLAPIMTAVELLGRHPAAAREREVIGRNAEHLVRLVDDLLDISRVTRGNVQLKDETVMLASVLERAVEIASQQITKNRHSLRLDKGSGYVLRGDPVRLAQVFANLLVNAAKFTPPGGVIEVTFERHGERVRVAVKDTGRGIDRAHLATIFEPFVQVDRDRDSMRGGLGLGLAIVHDLVARHGGSITAESEGKGRGATFTVELPIAEHASAASAAKRVAKPSARDGVRVLVVDDNVDLAELLSEALRSAGFETDVAYDAEAALARWQSFRPDAAVLDVGLPIFDGYELARRLRAQHGTGPMLIAATGYGQPRDRRAAADAGFDFHFVKPVSVSELVSVLDARASAAERGTG